MNVWEVLGYPHLTEKSVGLVETENKLVFIVNKNVNKKQVKWAVEKAFEVKVDKINILNDMKNRKKAFVKLNKNYSAMDVATKLGMM